MIGSVTAMETRPIGCCQIGNPLQVGEAKNRAVIEALLALFCATFMPALRFLHTLFATGGYNYVVIQEISHYSGRFHGDVGLSSLTSARRYASLGWAHRGGAVQRVENIALDKEKPCLPGS